MNRELTKSLPMNYMLAKIIDISKDRRLLVILNILGLVLFVFSAWLMIKLAIVVRVRSSIPALPYKGDLGNLLLLVLWIIAITFFLLVIHELIHGLFFLTFTGNRPKFGFRYLFAYTAAPEWFIPRRYYLLIAIAPVVTITMIGIIAVFVIADTLLPALVFLTALNISGSVGDLMIVAWLLRNPSVMLIQDYGDGVRLYRPG